jgi:hypothetical protein
MRHLGSFLLAVVLAPIVYLLTGVGLSAFGQATSRGVEERPMATVLSVATLAVAGGVYAVLVMARLSPIGPALAGFMFLATPAWLLLDPTSYVNAVNTLDARFKILGVEILGIDLVGRSGVGVLLAIPLIATLASPRRWSRYANRPPAEVAYYPQQTGYQQPYPHAGQTRSLDPVTESLPDIEPPTLHYPKAGSAQARPPAPNPPAAAPAAPTVILTPAPPSPVSTPPVAAAAAASAPLAPPVSAPPVSAPPAAPKPAVPPADATSLIVPPKPAAEPARTPAKPAPAAPTEPAADAPESAADAPESAPAEPAPAPAATEPETVPLAKSPQPDSDGDATVRIDPNTLKPL